MKSTERLHLCKHPIWILSRSTTRVSTPTIPEIHYQVAGKHPMKTTKAPVHTYMAVLLTPFMSVHEPNHISQQSCQYVGLAGLRKAIQSSYLPASPFQPEIPPPCFQRIRSDALASAHVVRMKLARQWQSRDLCVLSNISVASMQVIRRSTSE